MAARAKIGKASFARAKVGPRNPPQDGRFVKGRSGNPKGRPKGSKNIATYIKQAAEGMLIATIDGKTRKLTKIEATALQLAHKAASGELGAILKFLDWVDKIEQRAAAARPAEFPLDPADLEVLRAANKQMKLCRADDMEDA